MPPSSKPYERTPGWGAVTKEANGIKRHGLTRTPIWNAWSAMLERCTESNHSGWKKYGGRGIAVCLRWRVFENFYEDMRHTWQPGLTLGRKDNNDGYYAGNCQWETLKQQARNRRTTRWLEFRGECKSMAEWAELLGMSYKLVQNRIYQCGWDVERALTEPKKKSWGWPRT